MAIIVASSNRLRLRLAKTADWPFVLEAEHHPDNRDFLSQWTIKQHQQTAEHPDCLHLIIEYDLEPAGYLIIAGMENLSHNIELMRLVVTRKGEGIGRETLRLVKRLAFDRWNAHRLWLDVRTNNPRARKLYLSEGFIEEGQLRECILMDNGYCSLIVLSILEHEYRERESV